MATREFARIITESVFGTPTSTPVLDTDYLALRLESPGQLGVRYDPERWTLNDGKGMNLLHLTGSERGMPSGRLSMKLYREHAPVILKWIFQQITSGSVPWTQTDRTGDLASCTIQHAIVLEDSGATVERRQHFGNKVRRATLRADNTSDLWTVELDIVGKTSAGLTLDLSTDPDATAFPEPALADFPDNPYTFQDITSLKIGSTRTEVSSVEITVENTLDPRYFLARHPSMIRYISRRITMSATLLYASAADRASYENLTAVDSELIVDDGSDSWKLDMFGSPRITTISDQINHDKAHDQVLTITSFLDNTAGTDATLSFP
jgi:hypothetical protein